MKNFKIANGTIANIRPKRIGEESKSKIESFLPEGMIVYPRDCDASSGCQPGDMVVRYRPSQMVASNYRQAILALDLPEKKEEQHIKFNNLEATKASLKKTLDDVKLWNYAPERRAEVKKARAYLHQIVESSIEYGSERVVAKDSIDEFFRDEANTFEVAEYYYCVGDIALPTITDAKNSLMDIGESAVERIMDIESKILDAGKEKLETLANKLSGEILFDNAVLFAPYKSA